MKPVPGMHDLRRRMFQPFELLKDSAALHVDLGKVEVGVKRNDLVHRLLRPTRLPRGHGIDAEESAAILLVPRVQNKLVQASAAPAPAYLGGYAAVALIRQAAKIDRTRTVLKEISNEIARCHGNDL